MNVRFGNLTVAEFEKQTNVKFSDKDRQWLQEHRTDNASSESNNTFHIFQMPLGIDAGFSIADELIKRLRNGYEFEATFTVTKREADI